MNRIAMCSDMQHVAIWRRRFPGDGNAPGGRSTRFSDRRRHPGGRRVDVSSGLRTRPAANHSHLR